MTGKEVLELINESIELNKNLLEISNLYYEKDYKMFDFFICRKPKEYEREISYLKALKEVFEYLGDESKIKLGKYLSVGVVYWGEDIRISLWLTDDEIENKLYDCVFGSHSGINEFVQKHIPELISLVLGSTKYSYALGSYDFSEIFGNQEFGKDKYGFYYPFENEKYKNDIGRMKAKIDFIKNLSKKEDLINGIDNCLENYFNLIFKHCDEE